MRTRPTLVLHVFSANQPFRRKAEPSWVTIVPRQAREGGIMAQHPKLTGIEQLSSGWVNKYILTYEMPDGRMHSYECASRKKLEAFRAGLEERGRISRAVLAESAASPARCEAASAPSAEAAGDLNQAAPDAVCIVARTPRDTLVMIREFRYPLNSWCIAFPAGLIDPGEDVVRCACREMEEETGYTVSADAQVRVLPQAGFSSTGLTDETVQVVFVEAEKAGDAHTEPNELIEVFELPIAAIPEFLNTNPLPIGTRAQLVLESFIQ